MMTALTVAVDTRLLYVQANDLPPRVDEERVDVFLWEIHDTFDTVWKMTQMPALISFRRIKMDRLESSSPGGAFICSVGWRVSNRLGALDRYAVVRLMVAALIVVSLLGVSSAPCLGQEIGGVSGEGVPDSSVPESDESESDESESDESESDESESDESESAVSDSARSDSEAKTDSPTPVSKRGNPKLQVFLNERYVPGGGIKNACDVILPGGSPPKAGFPVVVIVHGGGWISGDKWTVDGYARLLAKSGIATMSVNYRLAPTNKFPVQVDDVRESLVWLKRNADRFSLDLQRMGVFGYSAGGHLSLLIALTDGLSYEKIRDTTAWASNDPKWKQLPRVRSVCAGGPPCDFRDLPLDNTAMSYFLGGSMRQKPNVYDAASPLAHVHADCPPVQLIHGDKDALVPIQNSKSMLAALRSAGVSVELQTVKNQGHMLTFLHQSTGQTMLEFFRQTLIQAH